MKEINKNQTACGQPTLKDGVCFGPHALTSGFMDSRNHRVFFAQIPLIRTIWPPLLVSPEILWYSAWLYQQLHFLLIERTCRLTIGFHSNSVSSIQDEAWTTYANCLLFKYWMTFDREVLGWNSKNKWTWSATISIAWILYPCSLQIFWGSARNPF